MIHKKTFKRYLATALISLCVILTFNPACVMAAEESEAENLAGQETGETGGTNETEDVRAEETYDESTESATASGIENVLENIRVYTEEDWDKWRVQYERIDDRPYDESEREQKIYSYTQVPTHDTGHTQWAGAWYAIEEGGKLFANFGCGVCCLSNIYSTFVQKPVDPGQMLTVTKHYTSYDPSGKHGAIDWAQMKQMCEKLGMTAQTRRKPDDYAEFQKDLMNADATVVLVCKDDDPSLWFYTNGHYVTLWEYNPLDDTVFVTDPGGLYNRQRVYAKDVYNALKSRSSYQYMSVDADVLGYR